MSETLSCACLASLACLATSPSSLPRAYLIGRPAVCCSVEAAFHDTDIDTNSPDKPTSLRPTRTISSRGSSRECHEDATLKTATVEFKLNQASVSVHRVRKCIKPFSPSATRRQAAIDMLLLRFNHITKPLQHNTVIL